MHLRLSVQLPLLQLTITSWDNKMPFTGPVTSQEATSGRKGKYSTLIPLPCLARFFFCSRTCQEKAFCAMLCHGPLIASRHGQIENGKHFEHISNPKQLLWEAFSSLALVLLHVCLQQAWPNVMFLFCFFKQMFSTFPDMGGELGATSSCNKRGCQWKAVFYQRLNLIA